MYELRIVSFDGMRKERRSFIFVCATAVEVADVCALLLF